MPTATRLLFVTLVLLVSTPWRAQAGERPSAFDRSHASYTALLKRHVSGGLVDYPALARDPALASYLARLSQVTRVELEAWPEQDRIAFWVNAYNAFTLRLIVDHYPVTSIRAIGLLPGAAFRKKFIRLDAAGPSPVSLNFIEHDALRKRFREPRLHFALVCASRGCPPLRSEAYRGTELEHQLEAATSAFLADSSKNHLDARTRTLHLSAIFKWFREDFDRDSDGVAAFVASHGPGEFARAVSAGPVELEYEPYDWALNGR